jgi:hypothetical protein
MVVAESEVARLRSLASRASFGEVIAARWAATAERPEVEGQTTLTRR